MITVVIKESKENIVGFEIKGHALSNGELNSTVGEAYDIICNSISVLSQSAIIGIEDVLGLKANYKLNEGFLSIDLSKFKKEELELCQILLKTFDLSVKSVIQSLDQSFGNKKRCKYIKMLKEEV
ncbi:ribosomal-processing cysteine protease Prp [Clostridium fallax]|uniref:Ribosomal processing cysteine protease Prp n=1 Tax=Clostridium fallax TaxID=1533 RepID=A0A1M4VAK0_9CLOT|nr:ribosomal-processing cysteine protease Prp [Clostridium fallax]SHE65838.1 hypothetical protein SAMN05443638_10730 [Clostridium fallax]SQB05818.1 putative ribosomal protein [Clostridium fallax]